MKIFSKKMIVFQTLIIFFVVLDRFLKYLAVNGYFGENLNLFGKFFKLSFSANRNIAFSLPFNGAILNWLIVFIVLGLVCYLLYFIKREKRLESFLIIIVILGAMSNLVDRLKFGYVIDYLDLRYFTVFNLADAMIVLGVLGLIAKTLRIDKREKTE